MSVAEELKITGESKLRTPVQLGHGQIKIFDAIMQRKET